MSLAAVLAFILANPELILAGEQAIAGAVQAALDAYNRFNSGAITRDQLLEEWRAMGVNVQAANDHWEQQLARRAAQAAVAPRAG
jgi:hypothetical protein